MVALGILYRGVIKKLEPNKIKKKKKEFAYIELLTLKKT